ncbi:LysR family transcriptional regulator [Flindersiella endophytica]
MVSPVFELREIELFLTIAEELHFGRSAERLGVTPSRVSQMLRDLERKLGGELVNRTSRSVSLNQFGERFLAEIRSPYGELLAALERASAANRSLLGTLRLGLLAANSGGPYLTEIIEEFERLHPECEVVVSEIFFADALGPLRRGEIDAMATPLPIEQSDLTTGPTLCREPMVLAVALDHPLADRDHVSTEDIASFHVAPITDAPKELIDAAMPRRTASGRPIRRLTRRPKTPHEVTTLIARGRIVHPTVPSFARYFGQPGITYIPIDDMPHRKSGLVWRRRDTAPRLREFVRVTRQTLSEHRKRRQRGVDTD